MDIMEEEKVANRLVWSKNGKPYLKKPKEQHKIHQKKYCQKNAYDIARKHVIARIGLSNVRQATLQKYKITIEEVEHHYKAKKQNTNISKTDVLNLIIAYQTAEVNSQLQV